MKISNRSFLALLLILIAFSGCDKQAQDDTVKNLENSQISNLAPDGEIAQIYNLDSKFTDLQRESTLKKIKGSVISWRLPVYEISREGDGYIVQTQPSMSFSNIKDQIFQSSGGNPFEYMIDKMTSKDIVGTIIHLTPRNENDKTVIEQLKTGDIIAFRGKIQDVSMRNLVISPAILEANPPKSNVSPTLAPPSSTSANEPNYSADVYKKDIKTFKVSGGAVQIVNKTPGNPAGGMALIVVVQT